MSNNFKRQYTQNYNVLSMLRVFACFLVVRGHYFDRFNLPTIIGRGIITGAGPVVIFFVISGFLAYDGYMKKPDTRAYYRRRLLRIIPAYYIILICCMIVNTFIPLTIMPMRIGNWLRYFTFTNMLIPSYSFGDFNNLFGFWTMGCFPVFYLLTPIISKFITSSKRAYIVMVIGMAVNYIFKIFITHAFANFGFNHIEDFGNLSPFGTLYLFLFGMVAAYAYRNFEEIKIATALAMVFLLMLVIEKNGYIMWGIAAAIICLTPSIHISIVSESNAIWRVWGGKLLSFLDVNSFNIYLLHLLISKIETSISGTNGTKDCIICIFITLIASELLRKVVSIITIRPQKNKGSEANEKRRLKK